MASKIYIDLDQPIDPLVEAVLEDNIRIDPSRSELHFFLRGDDQSGIGRRSQSFTVDFSDGQAKAVVDDFLKKLVQFAQNQSPKLSGTIVVE